MIWLWGLLAFGDDNLPELWAQLHEGQLVHLVDGAPQESIEIFQALLKGLSPSHPLFGDLLFSLGRAQYDIGEEAQAKRSVFSSLQMERQPKGALEYYVQMLAEEKIVDSYPYSGNPWQYAKEWSHYHAVRLEGEAQKAEQFHIDIEVPQSSSISVEIRSSKGLMYQKQYPLAVGSHRLSLSKKMLPKDMQKEGVFLITLTEDNQKSIRSLLLDIP